MCERTNRLAFALLSIAFICALTACGGESSIPSNLSGAPEEILAALNEEVAAAGIEAPMVTPPVPVTAEAAPNTIGLTVADFEEYVSSAASSIAAVGTFAHQIIIIEAKDASAAVEVKKLVSGDGGYDPNKWICVHPEKAFVVESGNYVLLAAASASVCDAALESFGAAAGSIGEVNTFWEAPQ